MIPQKIHYIWLSDQPMPSNIIACIQSWHKHAKDYEIKRWKMQDFDFSRMPAYVKEAIQQEKWAFACDYLRLYVLEREGGIYLDSDVLMLASPDRFLQHAFFSAVEYYPDLFAKGQKKVDANGDACADVVEGMAIQAAVMGSVPHHPFVQDVMRFYETHHFTLENGSVSDKLIASHLYAVHARKYGFQYRNSYQELSEGMVLYPSEIIAPGYCESTCKSDMIHLCAGSWRGDAYASWPAEVNRQIRDAVVRREHPLGGAWLALEKAVRKVGRSIKRRMTGKKSNDSKRQ